MDPNEYKRKLEQYVVLNDQLPGDRGDIKQSKAFAGGNEIVSWHPGSCADCGQETTKPIVRQITRLRASGWRERCINCNHVRNPETGAFDLRFGEITSEHKRLLATQRYHLNKQSSSTESCPNDSRCDSAASAAEHESPEP